MICNQAIPSISKSTDRLQKCTCTVQCTSTEWQRNANSATHKTLTATQKHATINHACFTQVKNLCVSDISISIQKSIQLLIILIFNTDGHQCVCICDKRQHHHISQENHMKRTKSEPAEIISANKIQREIHVQDV